MPFGRLKGTLQITKWHFISIVDTSCDKWMIFHQNTQMAIKGKHTDYGGGSQKIINCLQIFMPILMSNMKLTKIGQNTFYAHFKSIGYHHT